MQTKKKSEMLLRWVCFAVLLTAVLFRLAAELDWHALTSGLHNTEKETLAIAAEPPSEGYPTMPYTVPGFTPDTTLTAEDAALVSVQNTSWSSFDAAELIEQPIPLTLDVDGPVILIVHTHASEAYAGSTHTENTEENVVCVGAALADRLNNNGIYTLHDTTLNDLPGYNDAYERTAEVISRYLAEYPSIQMVIDVHRDAISDNDGNELALTAELGGEPAAKLLFVMGTDTEALPYPAWQGNLSVALQLQAYCEKYAPGLFRELALRAARYNQHLTPCSLLLEVGAAGNSLEEAVRSAEFFADRLSELLLAQEK